MQNRLARIVLSLCAICLTNHPIASTSPAHGADRPASKSAVKAKPLSKSIEVRDFEVRVDNTLRGTHQLTITTDGDNEQAEMKTDVKVDVIVYTYVFKSRGTELWDDGRLVQSDIRCEDGGKKRAFTLKTQNEIQQISFNEKSMKGNADALMSTAYWRLPNAALRTKRFPVVDVDSGKIFDASVTQVGTEIVNVGSRTIECRRFKIDSSSPAELWIDDRDRLVKQKSVEQGHAMEMRLKQIRVPKDEKNITGMTSPSK